MSITALDALVSEWFLARYGSGEFMQKGYDPGTGHAAQIAERGYPHAAAPGPPSRALR